MDPALLNYMQTIEAQQQQYQGQQPQEQQQMPPQEGNSPFVSGANAAIQSAKQSLGMNAEEKNRAQGLAIMNFFTNLSKGGFGPGFNGRLAGITQSLNPAVQAYMQEQNNVAALNSQLGEQYEKQQQHQAMMQQKMMEHQAAQAHREAQLGETRRAHQATEQHRSEKLGQMHGFHQEQLALKRAGFQIKHAAEAQKKTGKIPPQLYTKLNQDLKELKPLSDLMAAYDAAEELVQKEDSLYSPAAEAAFSIIGGRPKALRTPGQAEMEVLEGDIKAAKYAGKGLRSTVEFKSLGTPDPRLSKEANLAIIKRAKEILSPVYEKKKQMEDLYGRLLGGDQLDSEDFAHYFSSSPGHTQAAPLVAPQTQAPITGDEQWIQMRNSSGQPEEVHPEDVAKAESMGYTRL
jgi:hypothetical protein